MNALKVSLWWTALSPVALAMVDKDSVLGAVRLAFNISLMLLSPLAGEYCIFWKLDVN